MFSSLSSQSPWFSPNDFIRHASTTTVARARTLYATQKVLDLQISPDEDHWLLEGRVQGSQRTPYDVSVELTLTTNGKLDTWDSDCTCPVGYNCKHGVALTLKAAYRGLSILGDRATAVRPASKAPPTAEELESARQAAQARLEEAQRLEAEGQLLQWFYDMDRAAGAQSHSTSRSKSPTGNTSRYEQCLYLLTPTGASNRPQQLHLEATSSYTKANGEWAKPKAIRTPPCAGQALYDQASETDREVLQILLSLSIHNGNSGYYSAYSNSPSATLHGKLGLIALQQAASTGRLFLANADRSLGTPLRFGAARELDWKWHETASAHGNAPAWVLRGQLADRNTGTTPSAPMAQLFANSPPLYLDRVLGECGLAHAPGVSDAQLAVLLKSPVLQSSALKKHQIDLLQRLGSVPAPPILDAFTTLSGILPTAHLQLSPNPPTAIPTRGLVQAVLRFDYQGLRGWWTGQGNAVLIDAPQGRVLLQRNAEVEFEFINRLMDLGLQSSEGGVFGLAGGGGQQTWLHWADTDFSVLREADFDASLDPALQGWITHVDALDVQLQPHGHNGDDDEALAGATSPWFDLSLGIEINGQRHNILPLLPSLIAAAATHPINAESGLPDIPPFVYLPTLQVGQHGFIRLPTETLKPWMAALLELVGDRDHDFSASSLKLSRLDAMRTTAALGEGAVWDGMQQLRELVQSLSGCTELPSIAVPTSVKADLRPYQQQGLNWLQFLREHGLAGILADDMGLGKTLQTLAHIQVEKDAGRLTHPALIIAPVSLLGNWRREAERFCPQLRCLVIHGKDRHEVAQEVAAQDLVIAPYSLLQRDKDRWLDAQWHLVVLDEAQNIKNASTHAAQVVGQLNTQHRLCLSGTPMENHLGEIWSLFHFLMPGFLGSQTRFKELFRTPIEKQGDPERLHQLRARITPFMLRRTKALVATELPPKVESVKCMELSGKQADLYETIRLGMEKTVREALNSKGLAKSQITILDALLKLRQVCCDPRLLKLTAAQKVKTSAKLEQLMELLPEMLAEGRRILLFSQFTSMLTLIEAELKKRSIAWVKLTGQSQNRDALIAQFTSGEVPLFLISLKAGGVGLNLPQADTVIHYDPWWNPAVENQATDRAHRIGQEHTVFVYKLVAQGTIEERILALQERKATLAESMYSGSTGRKQPLFTESDLAELLKPLSL